MPKAKTMRVTFISHRGLGAYLNLYPEYHFVEYSGTFKDAAASIWKTGFILPKGAYNSTITRCIPPSAIIEISTEAE